MGTMVDPSKRDKYTLFELVTLVKKYESIQNNINLLQRETRVSEFSDVENLNSEDTDIHRLIKRRSGVFSLRKLRQTIICGVHCERLQPDDYQIGRKFTLSHHDSGIEVIEEQPDEELMESFHQDMPKENFTSIEAEE